jgi:perosamine synthetase
MYNEVVQFIRQLYGENGFIPLHEPRFNGNEKKYLLDCIESTFVSSVGEYVNRFERDIAQYTGTSYGVAVVNGTAALHTALILADVNSNSEVITQPLSFIATSNAIRYQNANPIFVDVDKDTMGLSPEKLEDFLKKNTTIDKQGNCINKTTKRIIMACVPMHTFGHPARIDEIAAVCKTHHLFLIEDAAESIGSSYKGQQTGSFGKIGVFSLNGNKTITSGGGGALVTNNESLAKRAKHLTTQAKVAHPWNFEHDELGYNYRLPNINAALACAQLEQLDQFIASKRKVYEQYKRFFESLPADFFIEPQGARSNCWLNALVLASKNERDAFLEHTNAAGVMTRPIWKLMNNLALYKAYQHGDLSNAQWLEDRVVNIPSSVTNNE